MPVRPRRLRGRAVALALLTAAVPVGMSAAPASAEVPVVRLAGDDRYATAVAASRADFPDAGTAGTALLARGDVFADALSAAPLAFAEQAPVLLTEPSVVPHTTMNELRRVLPKGRPVVIMGGPSAVGPDVASALEAEGWPVVRVAGADRVETSVRAADRLAAGGSAADLVLVSATSFADALAAAPWAAMQRAPILLTGRDDLSPAAADFIERSAPRARITVVGGEAVVADSVVVRLRQAGRTVDRLAGTDRYGTAAVVATQRLPDATRAVVATGVAFPDALTGGVHAARLGAPVLLTSERVATGVRDYLTTRARSITRVDVLGGEGAVPAAVVEEVRAALRSEPEPAPSPRPFSATSAWNSAIVPQPVVDPASSAQVAHLSAGARPAVANLYRYGIPIWEADAGTPRYAIDCTRPWGTCGLEGRPVPVPDAAFAQAMDADGAMVVVDHSSGQSYEFYEANRVDGTWQAGWGGVLSTTGDGVGTPASSATGSAVSRLAGVVRIEEVRRGVIDHALVFATDNACTGTFRYPAAKTDGRSQRSDCIPEGARVQLDPSIDLTTLELTPGERMVARALQVYGAYAIDNGGVHLGFSFEAPSGEADPYPSVGLTSDYFALDGIPWDRLRVLRAWDGR